LRFDDSAAHTPACYYLLFRPQSILIFFA